MNGVQLTLSLLEDERLGVEERSLVACLLSRWLSRKQDQRLSSLHMLGRALRLWGSTPVYVGGELGPARCEAIISRPVHAPANVMARLGIDREHIHDLWLEAEQRDGVRAHLPLELLEALLPLDFWRVALALIEDGPIVAGNRLSRALESEGRRLKPPTPKFPDGSLVARATLAGYRAVLRRFMAETINLQVLGHEHALLAPWVHLPEAPRIRGGRIDVSRPAPTLLHMRQVWRWWADAVRQRYGSSLLALPDRVVAMSDRQLRQAGPLVLKNFVILTIFLLSGGRLLAISNLRRGDFEPTRRLRDGTTAPVLLLRPRKHTDSSIVRPKPLPLEAAALLAAWLIVAERHYGWPTEPHDPLMPGNGPGRAMAYSSYAKTLKGGYGSKKPRIAIVPMHVDTLGKRTTECDDAELCGYGPHTLRRFADQTARRAAKDWVSVNPGPADANDIAEVLLDHAIPKDPYGYAGISSEEGREHYSQIAVAGIWRLLTTDDGARKVVDAEALRAALRERTALETELTRLRRHIDAEHEDIRAAPLSAAKRKKDLGLLVELVGRQAELSRIVDAERRMMDRLHAVEREIDRLKHDPACLVPLPDQAPAEAATVTSEAIELEETGVRSIRGRPVRRLRDWLTPREFAEWFGVGEATGRRWLRGLGLRPGDPWAPWEPDDIPVVEISPRRRVILVDRIKPTCVTDVPRREALEELLATWPTGWQHVSMPDGSQSVTGQPGLGSPIHRAGESCASGADDAS